MPGRGELEAQTTLPRSVGQSLDAAVEDVGTTVEDDLLGPGLDGALGAQLADASGSGGVRAGLERGLKALVQPRGGRDAAALRLLDHPDEDVLRRAELRMPQPNHRQ